MRRDRDPSFYGGNRLTRRALKATALALSFTALAASGCRTEAAAPKPEPTTSSTTASTVAEIPPKALGEYVQSRTHVLAKGIIDAAGVVNDPRFSVKTTPNTSAEGGPNAPKATTTVTVKTTAEAGDGDFGVYTMTVSGDLDAAGKNVDPNTAQSISIAMDVRKNGDPGDIPGQFYSFESARIGNADEWHVVHLAAKQGGQDYGFYVAGANVDPNNGQIQPLTLSEFQLLDVQANAVLKWAAAAQAVNYAPQS